MGMEGNETPMTFKIKLISMKIFVISTINKSMMIHTDTEIMSMNLEMVTVG